MRVLGQKSQTIFFLNEKILHQKKHKKQTKTFTQIFLSASKSIKSKQATFTHKKHKMQTSNLCLDIFMRLKRGQKIGGFFFLDAFKKYKAQTSE